MITAEQAKQGAKALQAATQEMTLAFYRMKDAQEKCDAAEREFSAALRRVEELEKAK